MSENMFEKWNQSVDLTGLKNDIAEAKSNGGGDYEKVPHGEYEVKLEKLELKPTKKDGSPMVSAWFTILNGKYKNFKLFMNQVITQGFQIHICNQFLNTFHCIGKPIFRVLFRPARMREIQRIFSGNDVYYLTFRIHKKKLNC